MLRHGTNDEVITPEKADAAKDLHEQAAQNDGAKTPVNTVSLSIPSTKNNDAAPAISDLRLCSDSVFRIS